MSLAAAVVESHVDVPEGVEVEVEGKKVAVRGERGSLTRDFRHAPVDIEPWDQKIRVHTGSTKKRERSVVKTIAAHIQNMIKGVEEGFTYKLKMVYVHFPITVRVEGKRILIQNFTGERNPRIAKIFGDVEVTVSGDDIIVSGIDVEAVAQTAANIQQATRIRRKDVRKFIDGIYVYSKE
ncbi:MAG: 50S ribosomal protein L6 [Candidatus Bathyarchaeia archaeon]